VKPGKVVPVKQKQRQTKTEKKVKHTKRVLLPEPVMQQILLLGQTRSKLATMRCGELRTVDAKSALWDDPNWIVLSPERKDGFAVLGLKSKTFSQEAIDHETSILQREIALLKSLLMGKAGSGLGLRFSIRLANQQPIVTNSATGKYFQFFNGGIAYAFSNLSNATEFTSLDVLFDEVFIHKLEMHYKPRNKYCPYVLVTGNVQSCLACIHVIPHNDPPYADGATLVQTSAVTTQHKLVNVGEEWTFTAHNPTRFEWDGDVQDQTTSQAGMGWCAFPQVATKYGGNVYLATIVPTAAAASNTAWAPSWPLGDMVVYFDISVRARA